MLTRKEKLLLGTAIDVAVHQIGSDARFELILQEMKDERILNESKLKEEYADLLTKLLKGNFSVYQVMISENLGGLRIEYGQSTFSDKEMAEEMVQRLSSKRDEMLNLKAKFDAEKAKLVYPVYPTLEHFEKPKFSFRDVFLSSDKRMLKQAKNISKKHEIEDRNNEAHKKWHEAKQQKIVELARTFSDVPEVIRALLSADSDIQNHQFHIVEVKINERQEENTQPI